MLYSGAEIVGGEGLGNPGGDTGTLGKETVGSPIEEHHNGNLISICERCLLMEFPGNGHSTHAGHLQVDNNRGRSFCDYGFDRRGGVAEVNQGVVGLI